MAHVEKVWDRLEFRTPWAKARELDRIRMALARFLAWHHGNSRAVLGIEAGFRAVLDLPNGERVRLDGYADRIELDGDGRVVVVDLKSGRTKPSDKSVLTNVQLGLYQLAVDHGAADELVAPRGPRGRPEARSSSSSDCPATPPTPPSRPSPSRPTTEWSATPCAAGCSARRPCCARRTSRPSLASTAATATSCHCARSRARGP